MSKMSARTQVLGLALTALTALTGCVRDDGNSGQYGEETNTGCLEDSRTALALDEVSPGGFSANDLLAGVPAASTPTLTWADGSTVGVAVAVDTSATTAAWVLRSWQDDGSGLEVAMDCPPVMELTLGVDVATDDGALAESWAVTALAADASEATATVVLDDLSGTLDVASFATDVGDYDDLRAWADLRFGGDAVRGTLSGQASGTDGDPSAPDSTAWAASFEIGAWGSSAAE